MMADRLRSFVTIVAIPTALAFFTEYTITSRTFARHSQHLELRAAKRDSVWAQQAFDYSSKAGWDGFYHQGYADSQTDGRPTGDLVDSLAFEWHGHISNEVLAKLVDGSIAQAARNYRNSTDDRLPSILLVGCGNSALPRVLHDAFSTPVEITCLDYSKVCIDMVQSMYGSCPNMNFVVGCATKLRQTIDQHFDDAKQYDAIIDKGLLDALLCNEGFEVDSLMNGVDEVLTSSDWGLHVLVSFPLTGMLKSSLDEMQDLKWQFDVAVEGSENGRGCLNVARRPCLSESKETG